MNLCAVRRQYWTTLTCCARPFEKKETQVNRTVSVLSNFCGLDRVTHCLLFNRRPHEGEIAKEKKKIKQSKRLNILYILLCRGTHD